MKFPLCIFILLLFCIFSCNKTSKTQKQNFDWRTISEHLQDSLIYIANRGYIPNSIQGVDAQEPEHYSKLVWILKTATSKEFEKLLYEHPNGEIKGIAIKGLIKRKSENLFEYFKYAMKRKENVRYYLNCKKLGGYALDEINYDIPGNFERYFSESQIAELNKLINLQIFECDK